MPGYNEQWLDGSMPRAVFLPSFESISCLIFSNCGHRGIRQDDNRMSKQQAARRAESSNQTLKVKRFPAGKTADAA